MRGSQVSIEERKRKRKGKCGCFGCLEQRRLKKKQSFYCLTVAQASLKLEILLPLSQENWDGRCVALQLVALAKIWTLIAWICGHSQLMVITLKKMLISLFKQKYSPCLVNDSGSMHEQGTALNSCDCLYRDNFCHNWSDPRESIGHPFCWMFNKQKVAGFHRKDRATHSLSQASIQPGAHVITYASHLGLLSNYYVNY